MGATRQAERPALSWLTTQRSATVGTTQYPKQPGRALPASECCPPFTRGSQPHGYSPLARLKHGPGTMALLASSFLLDRRDDAQQLGTWITTPGHRRCKARRYHHLCPRCQRNTVADR